MTYFTDNPLERVMIKVPIPLREVQPPTLPENHPCYGCGRYGEACILPCYRGVEAQIYEFPSQSL